MLDDNLEKYLKDNLESARLSWDKEAMWDDIEQQLPPEEKDEKPFVFWLWLGVAASILFGAYALLDYGVKANALENEDTVTKQDFSANKENDTKLVSGSNPKTSNLEDKSSNLISKIKNSSSEIVNSPNTHTTQTIHKTSKKGTPSHIQNQVSTIKNIEKRINQITATEKETARIVWTEENPNESTPSLEKTIDTPNTVQLNIQRIENAVLLALIDTANNTDEDRKVETKLITATKSPKASLFSIGTYASIGQVQRQLTTSTTNQELLNLRREGEQTLEAWSTGITFRKEFNNRLFVQTGLEYMSINEQLTYSETEIETSIVESDTAQYYQSYTGDIIYRKGTVVEQTISKTNFTRYNEHRFWNVPVYIGYRLLIKAFSVSAMAGPVFTAQQSLKGYAYQDDQTVVPANELMSTTKNKLYSIDFQLEGSYNLNNNWNLFLGAQYRKGISGFSLNTDLQQQYNVLSIKLGSRIQF